MLRVGLTGGLGSGKSTVGSMFAAFGVNLIEADFVARMMMEPGQPVYRQIVEHFGSVVVRPDGTLNRRVLAGIAFQHGKLEDLNKIVHPPVIAAQEKWMSEIFARDPDAIAMVESALIFEADRSGTVPGWRQRFDRIIVVTAPDALKIRRFVARMLQSPQAEEGQAKALREDAQARLSAQISDDEKAALADYVIDNSRTLQETRECVGRIFTELKASTPRQPEL